MAVKCVTCTREFKDIHALKSHQPKCRGRADAHAHGFENSGRKLSQRMDVAEEEVVLERQELRERDDDSEPARKRKSPHKVVLL